MRYRIKDYTVEVAGNDLILTIPVPSGIDISASAETVQKLIKEAIRLVVDETAGIVLCSSMQKDKYYSHAEQMPSAQNTRLIFTIPPDKTVATTDQFTIEMDWGDEPSELSGGGNINITPYITMDGSYVVFNYFTPKQMAEVYIWLEGGKLWFELTKDEEGQYSLTTKCDIQELDGMFIVGGEEFIVNTIVDSFIVDLKGYKVSEVRIEGIDADLLNADFTWRLAETRKAIGEVSEFFGLPAALPETYEFMTPEEVCAELEEIMTSMDLDLTPEKAAEITSNTLNN
jgi:hypothetical protein